MFRFTTLQQTLRDPKSRMSFAIASVWIPLPILIATRLSTLNSAPPSIASYWQLGSSLPAGSTTPSETFLYALIVASIGALIGTTGVLSAPFDAKGEFMTIVGGGLAAAGSATYIVFVEMTRLHGDPATVRLGPWTLLLILLLLWGFVPDLLAKKEFLRFNFAVIRSRLR